MPKKRRVPTNFFPTNSSGFFSQSHGAAMDYDGSSSEEEEAPPIFECALAELLDAGVDRRRHARRREGRAERSKFIEK